MNDEMLTLDDILHLHTHCLICDCHFLRAVVKGYSYLTTEIKAVVLAENENEAKEKFKELTADLGYCMTKEDIEKHILDWMQSPKRFTDSDVFDAGYFVIP